ncbi:MAG TPA: hypothetical protein VJT09_11760 [Pyrinomonadaceae bacterium]|nr:hypothetical protein [Pyrinomonadaceae bacterium]
MKSCPSCQQTYPDDGPQFCTNDGTPLVASFSSGYGAGSSGYKWQTPGDQPPPDQRWQPPPPPGWGYQPPGQYAPHGYGMPYPQPAGGEGIASAALLTGVGTIVALVIGIIVMYGGASSFNLGMMQFGGILVFLSLIAGLTALILGIVTVSMSNRNPSISKGKGIVGICLGAIPLVLMVIGLLARMR